MSAFSYRARTSDGTLVQGHLEAEDLREGVARLRAQGLLVISLEPERDLGWVLSRLPALRTVSTSELAPFLRQFATMVSAGLPVVKTLRVLAEQSRNRALRRALAQALTAVEGGETLAGAFARTHAFPAIMIHMIGAGEVGGILEAVLERLATQIENEERLRHKIRSACIYPAVVSSLSVAVVVFLILFVVPRFVQFFADMGGTLPLSTRLLIGASDVLRRWWWLALMAGAGAVGGVHLGARSGWGRAWLDHLALRLPVFGPLMRKYSIARFCRVLAGLMGSGIPILKALAVAERVVGNRHLGAAILAALDSVRKGQTLVAPLAQSRLFPPMALEMIGVGEESGTLEMMLARAADFYEEEVQRTADRLSGVLEPLLICFLALLVGGIVVAMVAPVFELWTLIG